MSSTWKKVVLRGDNATDEQLTVTSGTLVAADSLVFADNDGSGYLKSETMANVATLMAGTGSSTGLAASSGVLGLKTDLTALSPLVNSGGAGVEDFLIVYDQSANQWKKALASTVGSAGSDTNTTYALSAADTSATQATLTLTAGGSGSGTDDIVFQSMTDATIDTDATADAEIIKIGVSTTPTNITKITNTNLEIGRDDDNVIDFGAADNRIDFKVNNAIQIKLTDGVFAPNTDADVDLGTSNERWKHGYFDDLTMTNAITGDITGDAGGNAATASAVDTTVTDNNTEFAILMTDTVDGSDVTPHLTTEVTINASTNKITAAAFIGALEGNADTATSATDADNADNVAIADRNTSGNNQYFVFSEGTSGDQALGVDSNFYYVPSTDTLNVQNLVVSGTETKVNTTDLSVTDKVIEMAAGSVNAAAATGAGIQINIAEVAYVADTGDGTDNQAAVDASFAKMPTLTWSNSGKLSGWQVQDYNDTTAASKFPIAIMANGAGAPADSGSLVDDIGDGAFYLDDTNSELYVRV